MITLFDNEPTELTIDESQRLTRLEATIQAGLQTFVDVGRALLEIRDARLYRQEFGTFEDYCRERWAMSKPYATQVIQAARVHENLVAIATILPATESQARPLAHLEPEQQREAWQRAVDTAPNGKITAAHVQSVVAEMTGEDDEAYEDEPRKFAIRKIYDDFSEEEIVTVGPDEEIQVVKRPHVTNNSGNNEWYTPDEYIAAVRRVMGAIDLDPASSDAANTIVNATRYYTAEQDGLLQEWRGRVWMNPPYASDLISKFANKLVHHIAAGDIPEAIVLVNNATETAWFTTLVQCASAVVFPTARIRFLQPDGLPKATGLQGQAVLYFGRGVDTFLSEFKTFGWGAIIA